MLVRFVTAAGVLAVLAVVPGPDMAVVTKRAVASGRRDGLRTVGGITAGLLVWGVLTVAGLAAVLAASATAYAVVKLAGAGYLVFLGAQALVRSRRGRSRAPAAAVARPRGNPWRIGLVSNVLDPKIAAFSTGPLPTLAPSGIPPHTGMALLVVVHAALTAVRLGGYVLKPAVRRGMDRVTGVVLLGFGVKVATAQP
jgi:threonine/homoserine/homoserine lactone efflux protein